MAIRESLDSGEHGIVAACPGPRTKSVSRSVIGKKEDQAVWLGGRAMSRGGSRFVTLPLAKGIAGTPLIDRVIGSTDWSEQD
jgi:hypothetical protein